jgi:hypothetical protein
MPARSQRQRILSRCSARALSHRSAELRPGHQPGQGRRRRPGQQLYCKIVSSRSWELGVGGSQSGFDRDTGRPPQHHDPRGGNGIRTPGPGHRVDGSRPLALLKTRFWQINPVKGPSTSANPPASRSRTPTGAGSNECRPSRAFGRRGGSVREIGGRRRSWPPRARIERPSERRRSTR